MYDLLKEVQNTQYLFPNTIEEIDSFSGKEFENFIFHFFKAKGYKTRITKDSNDKGIDIIVTIPDSGVDKILGIQTKRWSSNVNSQEIRNMLDGKDEYNCDYVWLITTSGVTAEANKTALNSNIVIQGREYVRTMLYELKQTPNIKFRPIEAKSISNDTNEIYLDVAERDLYDKIRKFRYELSKEEKIPAYMIFSNKTLLELVQRKPKTINELKTIKGLGEVKTSKYGDYLLRAINNET